MVRLFHVTSSHNRDSIEHFGLDWARMGSFRGIAGSVRPEMDGVFLCRDEGEAEFFCRMNADGGPVDVWAVEGIDEADLVEAPEGFVYLPTPIPPDRLSLWQSLRMPDPSIDTQTAGTAYQSSLTITLGSGQVLHDADAHEWIRRKRTTET